MERIDDWEQRKLGDLLTETKRPIKMDDEKEYQLVTVKRRNEGIISRGSFLGKDILVKNYFELQSGDYLISKRQVVHGANGIVPENLDGAVVSNEYLVSVGNQNITTDFMTIISKLPQMYKMFFHSSYGIDIEKLVFNVEDWKKRKLFIPSIAEQNVITNFFTNIDHIIALHQEKLLALRKIKTAFLEKIFNQEIRFSGFWGIWEQRKLEEVVDVRSGKDYKHLSEGSIPVYGTGGYMLSVDEALSYTEDAIGIGRKGTIDKPYILKSPFWTVDTLFYGIPREKYDINFVFDIFQNIGWKKKDESTGVPSLSKTTINEIDVRVPEYEEQRTIGAFFFEIDHLIALHHQKMDSLHKLKCAYLQKMFL